MAGYPDCSIKDVLTNFTKFTGKHLCQSLFLIKLQAKACNFIEKETLAQVFSCKFCKSFKNTFFTEHLGETASLDSFSKISRREYLKPATLLNQEH